jgi:hypothetical protein
LTHFAAGFKPAGDIRVAPQKKALPQQGPTKSG